MRRLLLLAVVFTVAAGTAGSSPAKLEHGLVYGLVQDSATTWLTRLDPDTLAPLGPRASLGHLTGFAYDTNGWLAYANGWRLRIVNLESMKPFKSIRLGAGAPVAVAWLRWETIVTVTGTTVTEVRAVDWSTDRVVRKARVKGTVVGRARGDDELVLLVGPAGKIGPVRLLVVDGAGRTRVIALPRIVAGQHWDDMNPPTGEHRQPALTLDAANDVAYVAGNGLVAEVPLAGAATYHALRGTFAKVVAGSWQSAAWLGNGMLALAGFESADGRRINATGLELVDTRTWTSRLVRTDVSRVTSSNGLALGTGAIWGEAEEERGIGVVAIDAQGAERFHALPGMSALVAAVTATRAYVHVDGGRVAVIDLLSGRVVRTDGAVPFLLTVR
jgi:hypothetical protein